MRTTESRYHLCGHSRSLRARPREAAPEAVTANVDGKPALTNLRGENPSGPHTDPGYQQRPPLARAPIPGAGHCTATVPMCAVYCSLAPPDRGSGSRCHPFWQLPANIAFAAVRGVRCVGFSAPFAHDVGPCPLHGCVDGSDRPDLGLAVQRRLLACLRLRLRICSLPHRIVGQGCPNGLAARRRRLWLARLHLRWLFATR